MPGAKYVVTTEFESRNTLVVAMPTERAAMKHADLSRGGHDVKRVVVDKHTRQRIATLKPMRRKAG